MAAGKDYMDLLRTLTAARMQRGVSQTQIAKRVDKTRQAVSAWESGTAVAPSDCLAIYAEEVGMRLTAVPAEVA